MYFHEFKNLEEYRDSVPYIDMIRNLSEYADMKKPITDEVFEYIEV